MKLSDAAFPTPPADSLFCPICQELFQDPSIIRICGHTFCASCILQSLEMERKCPLCRTQLSQSGMQLKLTVIMADIFQNLIVKSIISELIVYCPNKQTGCQKTFKVEHIDQHINDCEYSPSKCPYNPLGCEYAGPRISLPSHLQSCAYEQLKGFIKITQDRFNLMEDKISKQSKELERLREFVRTSKTNPNASSPSSPRASIKMEPSPIQLSPTSPTNWAERPIVCKRTIKKHACGVTSLTLDSEYIYSGAYDGSIKVFDFKSDQIISSWTSHKSTVWSMAVSKNTLFTGSSDSAIKVWDVSDLKEVKPKTTLDEHAGKIYSLVCIDGTLVSASSDKTIKVWDSETFRCLKTLSEHGDNVNGLAYKDGHLVSGSSDKTVKVWDINRYECVQTFNGFPSEILDVACGDSNLIYASTYDSTIQVWDKRSPNVVKVILTGHNWEVWQVEYHNGVLFSASFDHTIRKWDTRIFSCIEVLTGHKGYVHALKLGNETLVSACADKTVKIWGSD